MAHPSMGINARAAKPLWGGETLAHLFVSFHFILCSQLIRPRQPYPQCSLPPLHMGLVSSRDSLEGRERQPLLGHYYSHSNGGSPHQFPTAPVTELAKETKLGTALASA